MKKLAIILFSSLLLVGCSNSEETTKLQKEVEELKSKVTELNTQITTLETEKEEIIAQTESAYSNPDDSYRLPLQETLNMTLNYLEAVNDNDMDTIESMLSSNVEMNKVKGYIEFPAGDHTMTVSLDSYQQPLENFHFRGAGFSEDKDAFYIFFSLVGGEGDNTFNIETEVRFILEDNSWKIDSILS